jgi:Flp pilus assembly protein TadG
MAMLFGIFEMSLALYTYHFVSDIARQGTRYAIVRGSASCGNTPNLSNCNATGPNIQTYLRSLSFPNIIPANLTATTSWYTVSGSTYTLCTTTPPACNLPQNAVQVVVTYAYPLNIPFVTNTTLQLTSTSRMAISQ